MMDDKIQEAIDNIIQNHHKIIDDWCKAYMAQIYKEKGSIKPGDFILCEQVRSFNKMNNCLVKKYWFELHDKWIECTDQLPEKGKHVLLHDKTEGICVGYRSDEYYNHYPSGDFATGCPLFYVSHWMPLPESPK
jgi:hypothetical protein